MAKKRQIKVEDIDIKIVVVNEKDYISLTDMTKNQEEGSKLIEKWLSSKNTVEFLGIWEQMNNPDFNSPEFGGIMNKAGTNRFYMSVKQWVAKTNANGIVARAGKYGGTYAHKDLAFHFALYLSPMFNLLMIKEFQRLKEIENNKYGLEWDIKRILTKINYRIQTDAVQKHIIPKSSLPKAKQGLKYAEEADILNLALFGCTAKEWKEANPKLALEANNIRNIASINELTVLANLESLNSVMIESGIGKNDRYNKLKEVAKSQLKSLGSEDFIKSIRNAKEVYPELKKLKDDLKIENRSDYDKKLLQALDYDINKKGIE